jgi:hypothetical protein
MSSLSVSRQRIYNTGIVTVSLNYTHQILHIKSSLHRRTLATNSFLHRLPYKTELSWTDISTAFHDGFVSLIHGLSAPTDFSVILKPPIILRHGAHRKHPLLLSELLCNLATSCSIAQTKQSSHCCVFAGTCLSSRCLETGCITPLFYCCVRVLLSNGCFCCSTVLARSKIVHNIVTTIIYINIQYTTRESQ